MIDELMNLLKTVETNLPSEPDPSAGPEEVKVALPPVEPEEPYMPLLEGCCYMPPCKMAAEDLCKICMNIPMVTPADCDYYIGSLCSLMMHCLCVCLDSCDYFDESTMLRATCVALLQNLDAVVAHAGAPDKEALLACSLKLAKCCAKLEATVLGSDECLTCCIECLHCCLACLHCLKCSSAVAKLDRCIQAITS
jgi:hypothetical protein